MSKETSPTDAGAAHGNLFSVFAEAAAARPDCAFLEQEGETPLTYAGMLAETARAAAWLRSLGVAQGDRALVQMEKSAAAIIVYLACLRAGVVFIPLNTAYGASEVGYFASDSDPAVIIATPSLPAGAVQSSARAVLVGGSLRDAPWAGLTPLQDVAERAGSDAATILYTSGTTGRSKGAVLTHTNLASNAVVLSRAWRWRQDDVLLHALPIFHAHGLFVALHCALLHASPVLFHARFDPAAVMRDLPRATLFMGVPTFYTRLLAETSFEAELCRNMRVFISGSAPLLNSTFDAFRQRTGHTILERYGMTEALIVTSNPYDGPRIAGSVGLPLADISIRITVDGQPAPPGQPGMLEVKGPNLFAGYWRNPEKTIAEHTTDGYFISGDVATVDEAGVIRIVGRSKDLIISGGYNVYPKEIELAIDAIEGVSESAVIGVPHPDFGEGVVAVVARRPGAKLEAGDVGRAVSPHLATFKRPKLIAIVDELPRNAMGKVQKAELRAMYVTAFAAAHV